MYNDLFMMMVYNGVLLKNDFLMKFQNLRFIRFNFFVLKDDGIIVIDKIYILYFKYSVIELLKWSIVDKDFNILGYICYFVIINYVGREYNVWFILEILIVDGFYIFVGLFGLILNIYDSQIYYNFDIIGLIEIIKGIVFDFLFIKKVKFV